MKEVVLPTYEHGKLLQRTYLFFFSRFSFSAILLAKYICDSSSRFFLRESSLSLRSLSFFFFFFFSFLSLFFFFLFFAVESSLSLSSSAFVKCLLFLHLVNEFQISKLKIKSELLTFINIAIAQGNQMSLVGSSLQISFGSYPIMRNIKHSRSHIMLFETLALSSVGPKN